MWGTKQSPFGMQGSNPWQMPKQPSFGQWGQPAKNAAYGLAGMAPAMGGGQMPGMAQPSMGGSQPGMFQGGYSQLLEMLKKRRMMQMMMQQRQGGMGNVNGQRFQNPNPSMMYNRFSQAPRG